MKRRPSRSNAGFTLVELMIALVISGIVIGSMYTVGAASSRHFQVQHQIASMQSSLRFAMLQVKRDITRAGFMSSPRDVREDGVCLPLPNSADASFGGNGWVAGVSSYQNDTGTAVVDPTGNNAVNGFTADQLTLVANYATSNDYPIISPTPARNTVTITTLPTETWHSVQTDFGWTPAGVATPIIDQGRVGRVFPAGGLIRLESARGRRHFATLLADAQVVNNTIRMSFNPALPPDPECDMAGGRVAPLQVIRYGANLSAQNTVASERNNTMIPQLVRSRRMAANMTQPMPGSVQRVVLEYLAAFNLAFTMNTPLAGFSTPDQYTIGNSASRTQNPGPVNATPELIRAIQVTLAVRAPSTDPGMRFFNCANLQCMQLDAVAGPGGPAARVRALRAEIFLPNIATEGY